MASEKYYQRLGRTELPEGSVRLTLDEVLEKQWERIKQWEPHSEMWPFIHGPGILGGITVLTSSIYLKHYRRFFTMGRSGMLATFFPACGLTGGACMLMHHYRIQNELLMGQLNCATCAEVRSLFWQLIIGFLQPMIIAPVITMAVAKKNNRYAFPPMTEPAKIFALAKKATKPLYPWLVGGLFLHLGVTVYIVQKEGQSFATIMKSSPLQHAK